MNSHARNYSYANRAARMLGIRPSQTALAALGEAAGWQLRHVSGRTGGFTS